MKWQAAFVASLACGLVWAQTPAAPPGGVKPGGAKPVLKKKVGRIAQRARSMREQISQGRQVKSHVKVRVRLQNGNRLTGVVKDGRLVERVDGLRFVDAQARDSGAGIRLWYSGGTRSYIFVPFPSLKTYEVVQRLSQKQLMDIEVEMQMTEKRAKERAAKLARKAKGKATGDLSGRLDPHARLAGTLPTSLHRPGQLGAPPTQLTGAGPAGAKPALGQAVPGTAGAGQKGAGQKGTGQKGTGTTGTGQQTKSATTGKPATTGSGDMALAKQELAWSELLRAYPPKQGWNEAKKNEIARRRAVIGANPSEFEMEFVKKFDTWMQACEHNGIDPNAGVVKKPATKRERRRREHARRRGR